MLTKPSKKRVVALIAAGAAFVTPAVGLVVTAGTAGATTPKPAYAARGLLRNDPSVFEACATQVPGDGYMYTQVKKKGIIASAWLSPSTDCWYVNEFIPESSVGSLNVSANTKAGPASIVVDTSRQVDAQNTAKTCWIANHQGTVAGNNGTVELQNFTDLGNLFIVRMPL